MPTEQENYKLMWSIICQQMTGGQLKGIDWKKTAADIGIESAEAANKRWVRLKAELIKDGLDPPDASTSADGAPKKAKAKKAAVPKEKKPAAPKRAPKKRKAEEVEEDEEENGYGSQD